MNKQILSVQVYHNKAFILSIFIHTRYWKLNIFRFKSKKMHNFGPTKAT